MTEKMGSDHMYGTAVLLGGLAVGRLGSWAFFFLVVRFVGVAVVEWRHDNGAGCRV